MENKYKNKWIEVGKILKCVNAEGEDFIELKDIVYCKDCIFLERRGLADGVCGRAYLGIVLPYDYCSRAEKKDER